MSRFLFITWDGSGNQTPTLADDSFADAAHRLEEAIVAANAPESAVAWLEANTRAAKPSISR